MEPNNPKTSQTPLFDHLVGPVDLHGQEAHHGEGDQVELHQGDAAGARIEARKPVAYQAAHERARW